MTTEKGRALMSGLFGAALAVSISAALVVGSILLLDVLIRLARRNISYRTSPLDIPLGLLFMWGIFTTLISGTAPVLNAISGQTAILVFVVVAQASEPQFIRNLIKGFLVASVFCAVLGVMQVAFGNEFNPVTNQFHPARFFNAWPESILRYISLRTERPMGTRSHPLTYAEGLVPAVLAFCYLAITSKKYFWHGCAALTVLAGIVVAQGRAVWMATVVGMIFLVPLFPRRARWIAGLVIILAPLLILSTSPKLKSRAMSIFSSQGGEVPDQRSRHARFVLWSLAAEEIKNHPIVGVGVGGLKLETFDEALGINRTWTEAHNIFIQTAAEEGVIGLGILLWILVVIYKMSWKLPAPRSILFVSLVTALLLCGISESWLRDKEIAMIFWVVIGVITRA